MSSRWEINRRISQQSTGSWSTMSMAVTHIQRAFRKKREKRKMLRHDRMQRTRRSSLTELDMKLQSRRKSQQTEAMEFEGVAFLRPPRKAQDIYMVHRSIQTNDAEDLGGKIVYISDNLDKSLTLTSNSILAMTDEASPFSPNNAGQKNNYKKGWTVSANSALNQSFVSMSDPYDTKAPEPVMTQKSSELLSEKARMTRSKSRYCDIDFSSMSLERFRSFTRVVIKMQRHRRALKKIRAAKRARMAQLAKTDQSADFKKRLQRKNAQRRRAVDDQRRLAQIVSSLKSIPLVSQYDMQQLMVLAKLVTLQSFPARYDIVCEGDQGDEFYMIGRGTADVFMYDAAVGDNVKLTELHAGDYFGEVALIRVCERTATVRTVTPVLCFVLSRTSFQNFFSSVNKDNGARKFSHYEDLDNDTSPLKAARMKDQKQARAEMKRVRKPNYVTLSAKEKAPQEDSMRVTNAVARRMILKAMRAKFSLLSPFNESNLNALVDKMWLMKVKKGTAIICEGDVGDNYYVIQKGEFKITKWNAKQKKEVPIDTRGKGNSFGELALMFLAPRSATVVATQDSVVWAVQQRDFSRVLALAHEKMRVEKISLLKRVPLLSDIPTRQLEQIADALEVVKFAPDTQIISEGDVGHNFYLLKSGEAYVTKAVTGEKKIRTYKTPGDYFGEIALLMDLQRQASVTAKTSVECLSLSRRHFLHYLKPVRNLMEKFTEKYPQFKKTSTTFDDQDKKLEAYYAKNGHNELDTDILFKDLTEIAVLGSAGACGVTKLVRDERTRRVYALKQLKKTLVFATHRARAVSRERMLLASLRHPLVVQLVNSYVDNEAGYYLLEPCLGGVLSTYQAKKGGSLEPKTSRFCAASVTLLFQYLHVHNITFRNLRPEKILLDHKGYLKVGDLEFAKMMRPTDRTFSITGTPEYLAPEVVNGLGHNRSADWWTLGILLYELLTGKTPFADADMMQVYQNILKTQVTYPDSMHPTTVDFIKSLLVQNPAHRMGALSTNDVKEHEYFGDEIKGQEAIDWYKLEARQVVSPIKVNVKTKYDVHNFYEDKDTNASRRGSVVDAMPFSETGLNDDPDYEWWSNF